MSAGAWILTYLAVSLYVALVAWLESRAIDLDVELEHTERLFREVQKRHKIKEALAFVRLRDLCDKLWKVWGEDVANAFAAASIAAEEVAEATRESAHDQKRRHR